MNLLADRVCLECDTPIRPAADAMLVTEDANTPDESVFWLCPPHYDERMDLWADLRTAIEQLRERRR